MSGTATSSDDTSKKDRSMVTPHRPAIATESYGDLLELQVPHDPSIFLSSRQRFRALDYANRGPYFTRMTLLSPYATALLLGSLHALETDHMAAVTSFAARRPGVRNAVRYGARWALGHGGAIVVLGALLVVAGVQLPPSALPWLERVVGMALVVVGGSTVRQARTLHAHVHAHADGTLHAHVHAHDTALTHDHGHAATWVGLLHGLAGTGAAMALMPVVGFDAPVAAVGYLLVFAVGTVAAMALYALLAGMVVGRAAGRSAAWARTLARLAGICTILIGCVWLFG
jgi:hypothetical protein